MFDLGLAPAGGEHRGLSTGGRVGSAGGVEPIADLLGSLGEPLAKCVGDTGDLGDVPSRSPLDAERRTQFGAQRGLEHFAGGSDGSVQVGVDECGPASVGSGCEVGDQGVPVQEWIAGPAGAVPERSCDDAVGGDASDARGGRGVGVLLREVGEVDLVAASPADVDRFSLEPREGVGDGVLSRLDDRGLNPGVVADAVEHGHGFRCLEGEIESRNAPHV